MANCYFCNDKVGMPYTCKLCGLKYCSTHRLPEKHSCVNLDTYSTQEYKQIKRDSGIGVKNFSKGQVIERKSWRERISETWMADTTTQTWLIISIIFISLNIQELTFLSNSFIEFIIYTIIMGIFYFIAVVLIYQIRDKYANSLGTFTYFVFYPMGVAITILISLFGSRIMLFGKFQENPTSLDKHYKIGIVTLISLLTLHLSGFILVRIIPNLFTALWFFASDKLFWVAAFSYIPIWNLDGEYIYNCNRRNYFIGLILLIIYAIVVVF